MHCGYTSLLPQAIPLPWQTLPLKKAGCFNLLPQHILPTSAFPGKRGRSLCAGFGGPLPQLWGPLLPSNFCSDLHIKGHLDYLHVLGTILVLQWM